ncbi:MAG: AI-2E family transporter [Chloroflexota bacterium]
MRLFQPDEPRNLTTLIRVFTILGVLLILLVVVALLNDIFGLLNRFRLGLYLFLLGALLAYLMAPAVRLLRRAVRKRWAAVLGAYILLFAVVLLFGALLLTPFITQAQSLVKGLRNPSTASLAGLQIVQRDLTAIQTELAAQQRLLAGGQPILQQQSRKTQTDIAALVHDTANLTVDTHQPAVETIPPSYADPIAAAVRRLQAAFEQVTTTIDTTRMARAVTAATQAVTQTNTIYRKAISTPLLLLSLQTELDRHGIVLDLHDKFSQVVQAINAQVTGLLNNALSISLQAGTLLLSIILIFIISIYFVSDDGKFVQWLIRQVPSPYQEQVSRAVDSLDLILGRYLRTQIILALLAGAADATGALILGIPYPIVIFFSSFLLSLVPVIGPIILYIPPFGLALVFSPLPKPLFYLIWLLVGEQIVTNVIGPRLQGRNLGIHPLEAMAAALVGLPLAGIPGAFFAVPAVSFLHIVVRELVNARRSAAQAPPGVPAHDQSAPEP